MAAEFETDFNLGDERQKGVKTKRPKEFKNFAKSGFIKKYVIYPKTEEGCSASINKKQAALNEIDPYNLDFGIEYSLNKKNRWGNVAEMQRVEQLEDLADNVKITTVEKVFLRSQAHWGNKPLTTAYHEIDESGNHIVRRAKHFTAQEKTLTEKPRLPKKDGDAAERQSAVEEADPIQPAHVRYEITVAHPSEKYWRQQYWKIQDRSRCVGKVSNSRAKKATLNGYSDDVDEYSYESETGSYDEEDASNASDYDRPQNEYSLFDFVNDSSKKPKKSERFEFVDTKSVLSLSSDEESVDEGPSGFVQRAQEIPAASKDLFTFFTINLRQSAAVDKDDDNETFDLLPEIRHRDNIHRETEMNGMKLSEKYQPIPSSPKRYLFDLSEPITYERGDKDKFIVILERKTVNKVGITFNGNFVLPEDESYLRKWITGRSPNNVESLLYSIVLYFRLLNKQNRLEIAPDNHEYLAVHKSRYQAVPSYFNAQTETIEITDLMNEAIQHFTDSPYTFASDQVTASKGRACGICFVSMRLNGTAMEKCGHVFCNECWQMHCGQKLRSGHVPIVCPDASCNAPIPLSMLIGLMPIKHFIVYKKMLLERYLLGQNITYCPCCNQAINIIASNDFATLSCSRCNTTWCQSCLMPVHWPLSCAQAALYNDRFDKQKQFFVWQSTGLKETSIKVKQCPNCKTIMEKGDGCDNMSCRCGILFCWRCLTTIGADPHSCTPYPVAPTKTIELRDVKKLCLNNKMAKLFFEKCHEFRTRRTRIEMNIKLRNSARRMGTTVDERNRILNARVEALYLLEYAFAWLYICGKGKLFRPINSLCDRLEFSSGQLERYIMEEVKEESLKKTTDCEALSRQLINSLRDARLIMTRYEKE